MNHVAEHTSETNGRLGAEKHHGSSQFSFIAFETELQFWSCTIYLSTKTPWFLVGFATFWMAFRHLYDSFFPHEMKQRGLTAWLASLSGSALSLSLVFCWCIVCFDIKNSTKTSNPNSEETYTRINPPYFFSCLEQSLHHCWSPFFLNKGSFFSNIREQWSKPCCEWNY